MIGVLFFGVLTLAVAVLIVFLMVKYGTPIRKSTYKIKYRFLFGYIALLVLNTVIYFSFVQPNLVKETAEGTAEVSKLHHIFYEGADEQLLKQYKKTEWEITPTKSPFKLTFKDGLIENELLVLVQEREDTDNVVQVTLYEAPPVFIEQDLSQHIPAPIIHVENNQITYDSGFYEDSEYIELSFYAFEGDMITNQFVSDLPQIDNLYKYNEWEQVLQLSVPKDFKIDSVSDYFDVIRKKY